PAPGLVGIRPDVGGELLAIRAADARRRMVHRRGLILLTGNNTPAFRHDRLDAGHLRPLVRICPATSRGAAPTGRRHTRGPVSPMRSSRFPLALPGSLDRPALRAPLSFPVLGSDPRPLETPHHSCLARYSESF